MPLTEVTPAGRDKVLDRCDQSPNFGRGFVHIGGGSGIERLAQYTDGPLPCPILIDGRTPFVTRLEGLNGKGVALVELPNRDLSQVSLRVMAGRYQLPDSVISERDLVLEANRGNPFFRDDPRWALRGVESRDGELTFRVQRSSYADLAAVRGKLLEDIFVKYQTTPQALPNLLTIYGTTLVKDDHGAGYMVFALRDIRSDQLDGTGKPAGFMSQRRLETVGEAVVREGDEEFALLYSDGVERRNFCGTIDRMRHMGFSYSLSRILDVTNHVLIESAAKISDMAIPQSWDSVKRQWVGEHRLLIFIPASQRTVSEILANGQVVVPYEGDVSSSEASLNNGKLTVPLSGAALASLYLYARNAERGGIPEHYLNEDGEVFALQRFVKRGEDEPD